MEQPNRNSDDSANADEYLLRPKSNIPKKWALLLTILVILVLFLFISTVVVSIILAHEYEGQRASPKNVILMISDGFGPASETFARNFAQYKRSQGEGYMLPLDQILVGASRTRSSDSLVTDSAAGATAFSCAIKSYNGAIAVDDNQVPCATVLEAAMKKGMKVGLVATSRITHATPASFAAHVPDRDMENEIAVQEVNHIVDVMFGGGRRHFLPQTESGSSRTDDTNVIDTAKQLGYDVIVDRAGFDALPDDPSILPVMGLFTLSDMTYELDRDPSKEPSLVEMAKKALTLLYEATKDKKEGFFIMIEGSRIDHAAHDNDAATHAHEILMYQDTIEYVRNFLLEHPDTTMISVSDHECGGLTVGRDPDYIWFPEVLDRVSNSTSSLATSLRAFTGTPQEALVYVDVVVQSYLGISDATQEELEVIYGLMNSTDSNAYYDLTYHLGEMVSSRARIGWTTHGHTGVDVNLYSAGLGSERLQGNRENTEIGQWIIDALGLNLQEVDIPVKRSFSDANDRTRDEYHRSL